MLLPEPLAPMSATNSPRATRNEMPFSTGTFDLAEVIGLVNVSQFDEFHDRPSRTRLPPLLPLPLLLARAPAHLGSEWAGAAASGIGCFGNVCSPTTTGRSSGKSRPVTSVIAPSVRPTETFTGRDELALRHPHRAWRRGRRCLCWR